MDYIMLASRKVNNIIQSSTTTIRNSGIQAPYGYCEEFTEMLALADRSGWIKETLDIKSFSSIQSESVHTLSEVADLTLCIKNLDVPNFAKVLQVTLPSVTVDTFVERLNTYLSYLTRIAIGTAYDYTHFIIVNAMIEIK